MVVNAPAKAYDLTRCSIKIRNSDGMMVTQKLIRKIYAGVFFHAKMKSRPKNIGNWKAALLMGRTRDIECSGLRCLCTHHISGTDECLSECSLSCYFMPFILKVHEAVTHPIPKQDHV